MISSKCSNNLMDSIVIKDVIVCACGRQLITRIGCLFAKLTGRFLLFIRYF